MRRIVVIVFTYIFLVQCFPAADAAISGPGILLKRSEIKSGFILSGVQSAGGLTEVHFPNRVKVMHAYLKKGSGGLKTLYFVFDPFRLPVAKRTGHPLNVLSLQESASSPLSIHVRSSDEFHIESARELSNPAVVFDEALSQLVDSSELGELRGYSTWAVWHHLEKRARF